jgi:hypothetical protein
VVRVVERAHELANNQVHTMSSYEQIQLAMRGNMVWCRNGNYADAATPCALVRCPFKKAEQRLAKPHELERCKTFQITTPSGDWATAAHVLPEVKR